MNLTSILNREVGETGLGSELRCRLARNLRKSKPTVDGKFAGSRGQAFSIEELPHLITTAAELGIELELFKGELMSLLQSEGKALPLGEVIFRSMIALGKIADFADKIDNSPNNDETIKLLTLAGEFEGIALAIRTKIKGELGR